MRIPMPTHVGAPSRFSTGCYYTGIGLIMIPMGLALINYTVSPSFDVARRFDFYLHRRSVSRPHLPRARVLSNRLAGFVFRATGVQ